MYEMMRKCMCMCMCMSIKKRNIDRKQIWLLTRFRITVIEFAWRWMHTLLSINQHFIFNKNKLNKQTHDNNYNNNELMKTADEWNRYSILSKIEVRFRKLLTRGTCASDHVTSLTMKLKLFHGIFLWKKKTLIITPAHGFPIIFDKHIILVTSNGLKKFVSTHDDIRCTG